jgi:hypothetical protein
VPLALVLPGLGLLELGLLELDRRRGCLRLELAQRESLEL